jgi:O-antigen/teichoic acid export membrane protein
VTAEEEPHDENPDLQRQVRGSVLLTSGRILAAALNLVIQVLTVRALSQQGYAAFAYGLAIASIGETLALTGMHRAIPVLLPRHEHHQDARRAVGTLVLSALTVVSIGLAFVLVVVAFRAPIAGSLAEQEMALVVLIVLAVLGPIMSSESLFDAAYATFGRPLAIFLRQYLLVPGLRLIAVLVILIGPSSPVVLAWGYVIGGVVGLLVAGQGLLRLMRQHDLYRGVRVGLRHLPVRMTLLVAVPLFANNLTELALETLDALMLAQLSTPEQLALLRAIHPIARANEFVVTGFTVLFAPMASRMVASNNDRGLSDLYWQVSLWRGVLAFPALMASTVLAGPVTVLLFGEPYAAAAPLLAVIGAGVYLGALVGPNYVVLEVMSRFRPLVVVNVATVVLLALLNLALIPGWGGFGAAVATGVSMAFRSLATQVVVQLRTPVGLPGRQLWGTYAALLGAIAAAGATMAASPSLPIAIVVVIGLSTGVFLVARRNLDVAGTFPALARIPVLGWVLTGRR